MLTKHGLRPNGSRWAKDRDHRSHLPSSEEVEEKSIDGLFVVRVSVMIEIPHLLGHLEEYRTEGTQRTENDLKEIRRRDQRFESRVVTLVSLVM